MEKWKKRSIDLITSLAFGSNGSPSVTPYYPQKTRISTYEERHFTRTVPEKYGISSKRIYNMLCELEGERRANIHNIMILAGGEVICECSRDGYDVNIWHLSHSMSKTVCGMLIGILVDDGILEVGRRLVEIFPEIPYKDKRFASITVDHLLSMTTGVSFAEAGSVTESKWTEAFFASPLKFTPGTKFSYNSMNSYILARIVDRLCGTSFGEFLARRLFTPLGIRNYFWEKGPEGVEKGGWGLYLSAENWAKLGIMVLSGGVFEGNRVLSEEWVRSSTKVKAVAPDINGDFNYAYQMWCARESDEILFNGMLGQNVWICPRNNIVAVVTGGNNELFQESPAMEIIRKYLGCDIRDEVHRNDIKTLHERETSFFDCRRWVRPKERRRGLLYWLGLRSRISFDTHWNPVLGSYAFGKNNVGILPLVVRAMQNNMESSIESIRLERVRDELHLCFRESGANFRLQVGIYEYKSTVLSFRGEKYIVRAMGEALINSEGENEYRIELLFPELPNTRMLCITRPSDDGIVLRLSEIPNDRIVNNILSRISELNPTLAFGVELLEKRLGMGFVVKKVEETFNPSLIGADTSMPGYEEIVASENARIASESRRVKLLRAVVERFFKETDEKEAKPQASPREPRKNEEKRFLFSEIFDKISGKKQNQKTQ